MPPTDLPEDTHYNPHWEVTPRQVHAMLQRGDDFLLMDCRTPEEFEIARIEPGELYDMADLAEHLEDLAGQADRPVVVYCHHGRRSLMVASVMRQHGFAWVMSMAGGIERWSQQVDPDIPMY
jgi:rhodanese-related sulfurtransferase